MLNYLMGMNKSCNFVLFLSSERNDIVIKRCVPMVYLLDNFNYFPLNSPFLSMQGAENAANNI